MSSPFADAVLASIRAEGDAPPPEHAARCGEHDLVLRVPDRDRVGGLVLVDAGLRRGVGLERGVPVEVVGREVQPGRHPWAEPLREAKAERGRLDDERLDVFVERGDERHVGVADRERLATRCLEHLGDHRRHRGLAVGAGDREHRSRSRTTAVRSASQSVARSSSLTTGRPRANAPTIAGWCSGTPGLGTTASTDSSERGELAVSRAHVHVGRAGLVVGEQGAVPVRDERASDGLTRDADAVHERAHQSATPRLMKSA